MSDLVSSALTDLGRSMASMFGPCATRLRPGLTTDEIGELEIQLLPYHLPEDVRRLYMWHDGAEEPVELVPGFRFLSLREAIAEYRQQFALNGGTEGWNPLWFPLLSAQGDLYLTVMSARREPHSCLYLSCNQDTELYYTYPDLRSFVLACAECLDARAFIFDGELLELNEAQLKRIPSARGFLLQDVQSGDMKSLSRFFTDAWPWEWKEAIGRRPDDYVVRGADTTVQECLMGRERGIVQVRVIGLAGCSEGRVLDVADESGTMVVWCPRNAIGSREIQIEGCYEIAIAPCETILPSCFQEMGISSAVIAEHLTRLECKEQE